MINDLKTLPRFRVTILNKNLIMENIGNREDVGDGLYLFIL
jgi:hypothetical protein